MACLEEPIAASSIVPMYFVCQRARQDVKVALIGQGPDELFGGYKRHLGVRYGDYWRRLPGPVRLAVGAAVARLPRNETLKRGVAALGVEDRLRRYQHVFSLAPGETVDGLFRPDLLPRDAGDRILDCWAELLPQSPRPTSWAASSSSRSARRCPTSCSCTPTSSRWPTASRSGSRTSTGPSSSTSSGSTPASRSATAVASGCTAGCASRFLPPQVLKRRKRGFAVNVVDGWFQDSLSGKLPELLLDPSSRMFTLLQPEPVRRLLDEHTAGRQDNHKLLFSLALFEQWLRSART